MRAYLITIVMHDGSVGRCRGNYLTDWDALDAMCTAFYDAKRISARREAA